MKRAHRGHVFAVLSLIAAWFAPSTALADLKFTWECYLPNTYMDCGTLKSGLTGKIPFLKSVSDEKDADVVVKVTSIPSENGSRLKFDFVGKAVDGYRTEVHSQDKIPSSIDSSTMEARIMTKLQRGLDDFMDQKSPAELKDGKLSIEITDPADSPFSGRKEQDSVKWYLSPGVNSNFSQVSGVGLNGYGNVSFSFNYSGDKWRLQQSANANYSVSSQPVPGTNETARIDWVGAGAGNVFSYDLSKDHRWSAAALVEMQKNPQANYRMRANASAGLQFNLIPRQTADQKNFGFDCVAGVDYEHYDALNVEGKAMQTVGRQFCSIFLSWHFKPIDVSASLSENSILKDIAYRTYSANFSATWRVTDELTVSPWLSVQEINKAINEAQPSTAVYNDPKQEIEASMRSGVQQGYTSPLNLTGGFGINYIFGNGSLQSEDQRWKGGSAF